MPEVSQGVDALIAFLRRTAKVHKRNFEWYRPVASVIFPVGRRDAPAGKAA